MEWLPALAEEQFILDLEGHWSHEQAGIAAEVAEMAVQKCDVVAVEVVYFHCQISFLN